MQLGDEAWTTALAARNRLLGTLDIHGVTRECAIDLHVEDLGDAWRMSCRADVG